MRRHGQRVETTVTVNAPSNCTPLSPVVENGHESDWKTTSSRTTRDGNCVKEGNSTQSHVGAEGNVFKAKPWVAPSVQNLTRQMGAVRDATPLIIEGIRGDVINAVGTPTDNNIASRVLSNAQENRVQQGVPLLGGSSRINSNSKTNKVFGAVYEHRDCFGVPKVVGHTDGVPEARFSEDTKNHQDVRNMMTYEGGRSKVVWAGTAALPGESSKVMQGITSNIVDRRSEELRIEKLGGTKPYSRHGY